MANLSDPAKTIERIYQDEIHEIPYPVFLKCFDSLCIQPPKPDPAEPTEELKNDFRAVCMAAERGVADADSRGEDRIKEFYEYIYPAWKEQLREDEFQEYQDILDGKLKENIDKKKESDNSDMISSLEDISSEEGEEEIVNFESMHSKFEKVMQQALEEEDGKVRQEDSYVNGETATEGEAEKSEESPISEQEDAGVPVLQSAKHLSQSVLSGKIPLSYTDMKDKKPFSAYWFEDEKVMVRLVHSERSYYLYLTFPVGYVAREDSEERILAVTSRLGYSEVTDHDYRLVGRNYSLRLKFGPKQTHLACRTEAALTPKTFAKALDEINKHLLEIIKEFELGHKDEDAEDDSFE